MWTPEDLVKCIFSQLKNGNKKKSTMGIDVSSNEFNIDYLSYCIKKYPERMIKPYLLDQKFFGGVGNYIACEICARAGIKNPQENVKISKYEYQKILDANKKCP